MAVALYMDVHLPQAVTEQLLRRNVDVRTAIEDGMAESPDDDLLRRSTELGRVMVTFDVRFKALAEEWQRSGPTFGGLVYAHPLRSPIGRLVLDLELIANATDEDYWLNRVEHLPL
jgi:hypothetical protein